MNLASRACQPLHDSLTCGAVKKGWPRILVLNRPGASARRDRLLQDVPTRSGYDRDEYPPAVARGQGFHIRGSNPGGWMADVQYVPSSENLVAWLHHASQAQAVL